MTGRFGRVLWAILARVGPLVLVLLILTMMVFVLTQVAPGDAARLRLGPRASEQDVEALRQQLGLDHGLVRQYLDYLGRMLHGDFGTSIDGEPVTEIIGQRLPETAALLVACSGLAFLVALPVGWISALRRDTKTDHGIRLAVLVALFLPSFWVGFLLIRFVAIPTGWFPVAGLGEGPAALMRSLVLPAVTGAVAIAPVLVRSLRSSLIEVLDSEYVAVARSLGITGAPFVLRHVIRNALGPVVTLFALNVGYLFFGVVVLEATFAIPGLGSELVSASVTQDVFVVQAITLLFAVGVVLANTAGEFTVSLLDPKRVAR